MMNPFEQFFGDRIFVINRASRTDRWHHALAELRKLGIGTFRRFNAHEPVVTYEGMPDGNHACTSSHRTLLDACAVNGWSNMLVLEDDFCLLPGISPSFAAAAFAHVLRELPADWDMLYLGGSYGSDPLWAQSEHLVRSHTMMTTGSYAITSAFSARIAPEIWGHGPIDSLFNAQTPKGECYTIRPRLFGQYTSTSDLTGRSTDYLPSMTDSRHEEMLLEGDWQEEGLFKGKLQRRELAAEHDMNGQTVIVGRQRYRIQRLTVPSHLPPWYRGEPITYHLAPEQPA